MKSHAVALAVLLALWQVPGCGYRVMRYGDGVGPARSIAIVTLDNRSDEPGVELVVSEALRKEFLRRGGLRLVRDPGDADLVVRGVVLPFLISSRTVSSVAGAFEYGVKLQVELDVEQRGGVPLDVPLMEATAIYPASADVEAARKNRQEALRRIADVLANRTYDTLELRLTR